MCRPEFELFDLGQDPGGTTNLGTDKNYVAFLQEMNSKMKSFQKTTRDPWLII
jgi:N-sulfoglucosamine sulfohydrolase